MHKGLEIKPDQEAKWRIDHIYSLLLRQPYFGGVRDHFGNGTHPDQEIFGKTNDAAVYDWKYFDGEVPADDVQQRVAYDGGEFVLGPEGRGGLIRYNTTRQIAAALSIVPDDRLFVPDTKLIFPIQELIHRKILMNLNIFVGSAKMEGALALAKMGAYVEWWSPSPAEKQFKREKGKLGQDGKKIFQQHGMFREEILRLLQHKGDALVLLNEKAIADFYIAGMEVRQEKLTRANPEMREGPDKKNKSERPFRDIIKDVRPLENSKNYRCIDDFRLPVHFMQHPPTSRAFALKK